MELTYWSVRSFSMSGGDGLNEVNGRYCYFSPLRVSFYYRT